MKKDKTIIERITSPTTCDYYTLPKPYRDTVEEYIEMIKRRYGEVKRTNPQYTGIMLIESYNDGESETFFYGERPLTQKEIDLEITIQEETKKRRYEEYLKLKSEFDKGK